MRTTTYFLDLAELEADPRFYQTPSDMEAVIIEHLPDDAPPEAVSIVMLGVLARVPQTQAVQDVAAILRAKLEGDDATMAEMLRKYGVELH